MSGQIPIVDYLILGEQPHLIAHSCISCGARFFDRRNACAACFGREFEDIDIQRSGTLKTFTIVAQAGPGIQVPFVAGIVDCDGTSVRTNILNIEPDPDHVHAGMKVTLTTYSLGTNGHGDEAIGFGYEPIR